MPKTVSSDAEVVAYVAKTKGAIGYVGSSASMEGVKPLAIADSTGAERPLITRVDPAYPADLQNRGIGGTVRLKVVIACQRRRRTRRSNRRKPNPRRARPRPRSASGSTPPPARPQPWKSVFLSTRNTEPRYVAPASCRLSRGLTHAAGATHQSSPLGSPKPTTPRQSETSPPPENSPAAPDTPPPRCTAGPTRSLRSHTASSADAPRTIPQHQRAHIPPHDQCQTCRSPSPPAVPQNFHPNSRPTANPR